MAHETDQLHLYLGLCSKYVEVIGRVGENNSLQEFKVTPFGENFDLETYDQLVTLAQTKYRSMFD